MSRRRKNLFLLVGALVTSVTASIGMAYAAYVYNNLYENIVDFNTGSFTEHFAGGAGTENSPYLISNPDQLRSLQKLNVFGVFSENTYFKLNDSFTWSGDPLNPIGTEDNPFYSQFKGNGKTITNLVVVGSQTSDVGMFGYTAMGSNIQDFILAAPLIKVDIDDNSNKLSTTNPLAAYFSTEAKALTLSLPSSGTKNYLTINTRTINKDGQTFDIKFTSSDTNLLEWNAAQNRFNVKWFPSNHPDFDKKVVAVQLRAEVFAYYNDMVISHTLERWQINVDKDGTVKDGTGGTKMGVWKTIHDVNTSSYGPHGTYVGFFAGHLDGKASHLGMAGGTAKGASNGRIEISGRPARSYSILIGRTFDDNLNDDANGVLRNKQIDFGEHVAADKTFNVVNEGNNGTFNNTAFFTNTTNLATGTNSISRYVGLSAEEEAYMRFYPSNPGTQYVNNHAYQVVEEGVVTNKLTNVLRFRSALTGYTYSHESLFGSSNSLHTSNAALWFYLSAEAVGSSFFSKSTDYEVTMRIQYTAKGSANNRFQILHNGWNPSPGGVIRNKLRLSSWENLTGVASAEYNPTEYPVMQSYDNHGGQITNPLFEQEIVFMMTNTDISLWKGDHDLMFILGAGYQEQTLVSQSVTSNIFTSSGYYKRFFNLDSPSTFELNIVDLDVTFSSLDGNVNRQTVNVDFINNAPTFNESTGVWSSWNGYANTRMHFNVTENIKTLNGGAGVANYRFHRNSTTRNPVITYYQTITDSAWGIGNTDGYRKGTAGSGGY